VRIAGAVLDAIEQHARDAAPDECCGLLLGGADLITLAIPTGNSASEPSRHYEIDAAEHFKGIRHARQLGVEVVGAYHSHPRSAPIPSETDREQAFEEFLFVIAGTTGIRGWRLRSGNFVEATLVRVP
jgi:desampylase